MREEDAFAVLDASVAEGVTFFDTADEYGDGRSEQLIDGCLRERPDAGVFDYTLENFRAWTDRSRANLGVDTLDLVQPHCPPTPVYSSDAIARPGTASVQIVLNPFRLKPLEEVLPAAAEAGVGIIAPVPLATWCTCRTGARDVLGHRLRGWRRGGGGVRGTGTPGRHLGADRAAVDHPAAGRDHGDPGARSPEQARVNAAAAAMPPLPGATPEAVRALYDRRIRGQVHHRW